MLGLLARMVFAMIVIIGIMFVAARLLKTRVGPLRSQPGHGPTIEILARHSLTRNASLHIARIGEQFMVLGVTDHSVNQITEINTVDLNDGSDGDWTTHLGEQQNANLSNARKSMIEQIRELTTRHA